MTNRSEKSELLRKKHLYRKLIMTGKIVLPWQSARRFIGPDCAFHLYSKIGHKKRKSMAGK